MKETTFVAVQDLPVSRSQVFAFFADPANLEHLTPPWLAFESLTPPPLPRGEGAIFDYRIRVRGLLFRWRTLIDTFVPDERFSDRQRRGPYALWHHTHRFEDLPGGGTRMTDEVRYQIGWGFLGTIAHALRVRRDIERIFAYRRKVLADRFG